ncbi:MAG: hypothetical protein A4E67_01385 [Syntrophaceae bacterium PtaB.Bin038]|nr:hypothetical protein [Treponema sp.]OPY06691.1 MAG: hypothetical protein A4E67_01385 [Syntrophaceae bacterium PtaB.Bin038]
MITDEVPVGTGYQCNESFQELDWLEDDLGPAAWTGPGSEETEEDVSLRVQREAVVRKRRSEAVAAKLFQTFSIRRLNSATGVK